MTLRAKRWIARAVGAAIGFGIGAAVNLFTSLTTAEELTLIAFAIVVVGSLALVVDLASERHRG